MMWNWQLEVGARFAEHAKEQYIETNKFPWETFEDQDIVRQFAKLSELGTAALSAEKLDQVRTHQLLCISV